MNRRNFLKSLGALGLAPAVQLPVFASSPAVIAIPKATYQWAETIVRAHKTCNLAMLQRHLRLDEQTASFLQSQLIKNGVISAQANAYGIRAATNPMFDGLVTNAEQTVSNFDDVLNKFQGSSDNDDLAAEIEKSESEVFEVNEHGELVANREQARFELETSSEAASQLI